MANVELTLLEQMGITELEIESRKALFSFYQEDQHQLFRWRERIANRLNEVVEEFYKIQTNFSEIALLIGDADTLNHLKNAQRRYIMDLFSGVYDLEYVNNRLRIGLVHKRIGVEPKLYLSAANALKGVLCSAIRKIAQDDEDETPAIQALEKLLFFDTSLVFDTYIRSLISEIESAKNKTEKYAELLENKVKERTKQLEALSRTDPLTGLLNKRHLSESLTTAVRAAQRRGEPLSLIFADLNNFKAINDEQGHQVGDEILCTVSSAFLSNARNEDRCFRFGGDEFCAILPNCTATQAESNFVTRVKNHLATSERIISVSFGIAQSGPNDYPSTDELIKTADKNMYAIKSTIKNAS